MEKYRKLKMQEGAITLRVHTQMFRKYLLSFSLICIPFICFSCHITSARTSSTMLSRNGEGGHLCHVSNLRGKLASIIKHYASYSYFLHYPFIILRTFLCVPRVLRVLIMT